MKISSFDVKALKLPMSEPHRTSSVVIEVCPVVAISVMTNEGVRGYGIVFAYTELALKSIHEITSKVADLLVGEELNPSANTNMLSDRFKLLGTQGFMGMAIAGIDMALWDAKARVENKALGALLGEPNRPVRPYGNVGYDGVQGSADGAGKLAKQGFLGVKAKIGYPTVEEDIEVIRAMRSAVGNDVAIMVDYNQSMRFDQAKDRLTRLADEGLTWVEEPVHSHDFGDYVRLQNEVSTPLQNGENWWGPKDFRAAVHTGVTGFIMPDAQKCGGVTGWMSISTLADLAGLQVCSHLWPEVSAQLMSVTPGGQWLEYVDWFNPIVKEPLIVKDGYADISGVIGSGVEFDDEMVAAFAA